MHQGIQHLLAALEVAHGIRILHRPVLASRWIANGRGMAPVEFQRLVEHELPADQRELRDTLREPEPDMAPLDDYFRRVAGFQASPGREMP